MSKEKQIEIAVKEEYTTLDWIMEGYLKKAGFHIDKADYSDGFMAVYVLPNEPMIYEEINSISNLYLYDIEAGL